MNWWVRWENDSGEFVDDGPFASVELAKAHVKDWHPCVVYLILNDDDRQRSDV